ncbi:hypothetical protein B0T17DRAFT_510987 [Bombardia bombarda]|uniref:Uncharacterized protein n=1 Tax=Bombardia bombarda TaxID=252184 RepID=A0AA40BVJ6_9PEZI|nr:hypothetical protein B0T17DRAFT_510987 [Bombardia bombarda]
MTITALGCFARGGFPLTISDDSPQSTGARYYWNISASDPGYALCSNNLAMYCVVGDICPGGNFCRQIYGGELQQYWYRGLCTDKRPTDLESRGVATTAQSGSDGGDNTSIDLTTALASHSSSATASQTITAQATSAIGSALSTSTQNTRTLSQQSTNISLSLPTSLSPSPSKTPIIALAVGISVGSLGLLVSVIILLLHLRARKRRQDTSNPCSPKTQEPQQLSAAIEKSPNHRRESLLQPVSPLSGDGSPMGELSGQNQWHHVAEMPGLGLIELEGNNEVIKNNNTCSLTVDAATASHAHEVIDESGDKK